MLGPRLSLLHFAAKHRRQRTRAADVAAAQAPNAPPRDESAMEPRNSARIAIVRSAPTKAGDAPYLKNFRIPPPRMTIMVDIPEPSK